ncbi:hypothetical protein [Absidia glauca]|uniref:Ndc10 domain-containing protein n=1 Tax=Absidia glauca TaxID=4829 RepID=A0A168R2R0_ABSGL|nr:hypothetical protein [Absidia glauca]
MAPERVQQEIGEEAASSRNKNTDMTYKSKQLEFLDWCATLPGPVIARSHIPMHSRFRFQTPIWLQGLFSVHPLFLLLLPLVINFLPPIVIIFTPRRQTNERTSKRTNER